jgi:uncharacterized membrane protein
MKNLILLKEKFKTLTNRGKMITLFVGLVIIIVVLDCLF